MVVEIKHTQLIIAPRHLSLFHLCMFFSLF